MKRWLYIVVLLCGGWSAEAATRPNILWLSAEDMDASLGCYGDPDAVTPNIDRLAAEGVRFTRAFTVAPVCAPNRSCIITGMYPSTLGSLHMRSSGEGRGKPGLPALPDAVRCFPEYLRRAGYYCTNNVKEDYNFGPVPPESWDESSATAHWKNRQDAEQPFFAVFNYTGTHESQVRETGAALAKLTSGLAGGERHDPASVRVPPYHPDTPAVRRQWANYHDLVTTLDHWVAGHLKALEEAGLAEDTLVVFWSDHGAGLPRHKRWLYDQGTHIPLIVRAPKGMQEALGLMPGSVYERLVSTVDFAPTMLSIAGVSVPAHLQGQAFLGPNPPAPREFVFAARDRMDERSDTMRSVRDERFRYIRNYQPWLPYSQYIDYCERGDIQKELRRLAAEKALPAGCAWFALMAKPAEELYDTQVDPYALNNLASDAAYAGTLARLRAAQSKWIRDTRDLGFLPEPELARLEAKHGTRYAIHAGEAKEDPGFWETLYAVAEGGASASELAAHYASPHAAIRYWAVLLLGQTAELSAGTRDLLGAACEDAVPEVQIVAASALLRHGIEEDAQVARLVRHLAHPEMWVRVAAAAALDAAGEKARPAVPALEVARGDEQNKYVARLANHALNRLLGLNQEVP